MKERIDYSLSHAKQRAFERYGLKLEKWHLEEIVKLIRTANPAHVQFISKQSGYRSLWKINAFQKEMIVVYNKRYKIITTFLTADMLRGEEDENIVINGSRHNAHRLWWKNRKSSGN